MAAAAAHQGVWEFAPAARSGAFRSGDPFTELRAYLGRHPASTTVVAMESAAFRRGLAQHPPARDVVAVGPAVRRDGALGTYRLVAVDLGPRAATLVDGVPVHTVAALLVSMAIKPAGYRDWPNVGLWLTQACATVVPDPDGDRGTAEGAVGVEGMIELLQGRPGHGRRTCCDTVTIKRLPGRYLSLLRGERLVRFTWDRVRERGCTTRRLACTTHRWPPHDRTSWLDHGRCADPERGDLHGMVKVS